MRYCNRCGKEKPDGEFYRSSPNWCKECRRAYNKLSYRKRVKVEDLREEEFLKMLGGQ